MCSKTLDFSFLLNVVIKCRLLGTSGLLKKVSHAYLIRLLSSLVMSSMTKSPGDEVAMQMYLKQMMHSMSLIQSCRADHPAI